MSKSADDREKAKEIHDLYLARLGISTELRLLEGPLQQRAMTVSLELNLLIARLGELHLEASNTEELRALEPVGLYKLLQAIAAYNDIAAQVRALRNVRLLLHQ